MENDAERIREKVLRLIDLKYESDVAFERAADLPPKTVSNWRRGRSTSYMKQLAKIAPLLEGKTVLKEIYVPGRIVNIVAK